MPNVLTHPRRQTTVQSIGVKVNDKQLREMLLEVDEDGSGEIDMAEFAEFMVKLDKDKVSLALAVTEG